MIKLLATDLDGTLLLPKRVVRLVSKPNRLVLHDFVAKGGQVVIASGRSLQMCQKIANKLEVPCNYVPYGGGAAYLDGHPIAEGVFPIELLRRIDKFIDDAGGRVYRIVNVRGDQIYAYGPRLSHLEKVATSLYQFVNMRYNEPKIFVNNDLREMVYKKGVLKINLIYVKEGLLNTTGVIEKLVPAFASELELFTTRRACEITMKGFNKGETLEKLVKAMELKSEEVAVIGDDSSDVAMFKKFENSWVMGHAPEEVKKEANHIVNDFKDIGNLF